MTIKGFHEGLVDKKFSAVEAIGGFYRTIHAKDKDIHAFLSLNKDSALQTAKVIDARIAKGEKLGILAGIPLAIKDNILISGEPATAASRILEKYSAAYDATVISKLREEGAIFLGKTNLDEFAMGSSTENSAYGPTKNPHDIIRVPGGSSGGSAAAVAADMALGALGSDTGGSIRQPAAFCGVVGLKPTYGAVSRYGLIAMASSLDQIGPFAKTVEDTEILFKAIVGKDELDATSHHTDYTNGRNKIKNLRVGIPKEYFAEGLDSEVGDEVQKVIAALKSAGIKFKSISLPHTRYALSVYYIIMPAEVSTNLARYDGIRYGERQSADNLFELYKKNKGVGFGAETKRRVILGTFVLSAGYYDAYYTKAQKVRTLISNDFDKVFGEVDMVIAPTTPTLPFKLGEKTKDPLQMYLSDIYTIPANLAGLPGVSIPVKGRDGKLPVGFQLIGKKWREADILSMGRFYESLD
ncbi:MAG: Asp-tRNA(Asn)/Glu-tRNA(Gln) amidotransferase subunit GatA [Candidatus Colwellbacteria bacterium]|nr:Asp-tRNA(Asn)/Glu-tRNA(Gln) amidotransferase subunit GatA [Candidatus Colwellbacteria bacterium]